MKPKSQTALKACEHRRRGVMRLLSLITRPRLSNFANTTTMRCAKELSEFCENAALACLLVVPACLMPAGAEPESFLLVAPTGRTGIVVLLVRFHQQEVICHCGICSRGTQCPWKTAPSRSVHVKSASIALKFGSVDHL